jgi:hypothetical protein
MSKDDLHTLFERSDVPAPRTDLADHILAATENSTPEAAPKAANDNPPWGRITAAITSVAACAMVAVFALTPVPVDDAAWESHADAAGFADLYAWVEGEEGALE